MKTNEEEIKKITFSAYYESLDNNTKKELREKVTPKYMAYPTFYWKCRHHSFTELELQKLEELIGQNFER